MFNHPETDGQSERLNKVLVQLLRTFVENDLRSWDKHLAMPEFAYNSSYQKSIAVSPFVADLGFEPRHPAFAQHWLWNEEAVGIGDRM